MKDLVTRLVTLMIADKQCREIIHDIGFGKGYAKALGDVKKALLEEYCFDLIDADIFMVISRLNKVAHNQNYTKEVKG